jgi:type IV secretory pathway VirB10-like protein
MSNVYPKTIVLRNSIMGIVIGTVLLILCLMLHNLYKSSRIPPVRDEENTTAIQSIANSSDTSWYQNEKVNKAVMKNSDQLKRPILSKESNINPSLISQSSEIHNSVQEDHQEITKAMSAPITSNQLLDEKTIESTNAPSSASTISANSPLSDSDPNLQDEKNGFIQRGQDINEDYLSSSLVDPITPFEVQAGTIIPGTLITGINSDLPGDITGQVTSNVYDSVSGQHLLIPQGSKILGIYDSQVAYGQERVLVVWKRIIFPNGQSINLQGMSGVDMSGFAGFHDQVDNHYGKIFGSVILMSVLTAGAQLSQPQNTSNPFQSPSVGQIMAQSLGTNLINTGTMITSKNIGIQPTLEIRQGYEFNISVKKDIIFSHAYTD